MSATSQQVARTPGGPDSIGPQEDKPPPDFVFTEDESILTRAAGANAVLIPEHLEFGAVYSTPLATQHNFDFNGLLVKMTLRY